MVEDRSVDPSDGFQRLGARMWDKLPSPNSHVMARKGIGSIGWPIANDPPLPDQRLARTEPLSSARGADTWAKVPSPWAMAAIVGSIASNVMTVRMFWSGKTVPCYAPLPFRVASAPQ